MTHSKYMIDNGDGILLPATVLEWARWFEDGSRRQVAADVIDGVRVSTVCLGMDHSFGGPPLYYETMVFGGPLDGDGDRYETRAEAIRGHAAWVERVRSSDAVAE